MENPQSEFIIAKLNEVSNILELNSEALKKLVRPGGLNRGELVAGCTANCDCKGGYCGCNASVTANEKFSLVSFPEYMRMREERLEELKREMTGLETSK